MSSRESMSAFNDFYSKNWQRFDYDEALEIWQAAERQALELAAQICVEEANEHKPGPEDYSHQACLDCEERIRALMNQDASSEKEE